MSEVSPQGTYEAQVFILKLQLVSVLQPKEFLNISTQKRVMTLSSSPKASKFNQCSFIIIHSVIHENDSKVLLIARNKLSGTHLNFSKKEISRFPI